VYEVFQEALILPLFFFIGAVLYNKKELENRIKTGLLFSFGIYLLLTLIILLFVKQLTVFMKQDITLLNKTVIYIRLESVANLFSILYKFLLIIFTIKKEIYLYIILCVQMVTSIILDVFFVSTLKCSFNFGINGVGITNIIVNIVLVIISTILLYVNEIKLFTKDRMDETFVV
jgi:hypothetical protein